MHDVHGHHRPEPPHIGVDEGEHSNQEDACGVAQAGDEMKGNGRGEQTDPGGQHAGEDEDGGGQPPQGQAEPLADKVVGGFQLAPVVGRDEKEGDQTAAGKVTQGQLEEVQVSLLSQAGNADEGQGAGLAGHHREPHRPPGEGLAPQKIVLGRPLPAADWGADPGHADKVDRDDSVIDPVEAQRRRILMKFGGLAERGSSKPAPPAFPPPSWTRRAWTPQGDHWANTSAVAVTVSSISSGVWAVERKAASNWLGGR